MATTRQQKITSVDEDVGKWSLSTPLVEIQKDTAAMENSMVVPQKRVNTELPHDPIISLLK
jgi:hypothetical protein